MCVLQIRVAREFDVVTIKLSKEAQERLKKCEEDGLCTYCLKKLFNESIERPKRGCHVSCANTIYHKIDTKAVDENTGKVITSESEIEQGHWRVKQKPGRKTKNHAA